MHPQTLLFVRQYLGVVAAALAPVVLTAFVTMPLNLRGHPGELRNAQATLSAHMT